MQRIPFYSPLLCAPPPLIWIPFSSPRFSFRRRTRSFNKSSSLVFLPSRGKSERFWPEMSFPYIYFRDSISRTEYTSTALDWQVKYIICAREDGRARKSRENIPRVAREKYRYKCIEEKEWLSRPEKGGRIAWCRIYVCIYIVFWRNRTRGDVRCVIAVRALKRRPFDLLVHKMNYHQKCGVARLSLLHCKFFDYLLYSATTFVLVPFHFLENNIISKNF